MQRLKDVSPFKEFVQCIVTELDMNMTAKELHLVLSQVHDEDDEAAKLLRSSFDKPSSNDSNDGASWGYLCLFSGFRDLKSVDSWNSREWYMYNEYKSYFSSIGKLDIFYNIIDGMSNEDK